MGSSRAYALSQILKIDKQITKASKSIRYRKIQKYTNALKGKTGTSIVVVEDPMNMGDLIQVRRNSSEAKNYLAYYESLLRDYQIMFEKLNRLKKNYTKELFE